MAGQFAPTADGGAAIAFDEVEISILRSLTVQLLELIGPGPGEDADGAADPLAELFAEGPTAPPGDPALARLFPEAYVDPLKDPDDEALAASAEFRRYTENDLRARKREDALAVMRSLDAARPRGRLQGEVRLVLTRAESGRWLGTLNDLRLTIGSRLEITEEQEDQLYRLADSDPRKPLVMAYLWLGGLQETLIETLVP